MHKIALGLILLLTSCAPVIAAFNIFASDGNKAGLRLKGNGDGAVVTFEAGEQLAQQVGLYIGGMGLKVEDSKCKPVNNGIGCDLGNIEAGKNYAVTVTGSKLSANATYYRAGSDRPFLLLAEAQ
jgi:hypothetical protein